jgi:Domain of unknown function (DUF6430)
MSIINALKIGIQRNYKLLLQNILVASFAIWGVLEPLLALAKIQVELSWDKYLFFLIISLIIGIIKSFPLMQIKLYIRNTPVKIVFGNLFELNQVNFKVLPVSQYFFETKVIPNSIQDQLIKKFLNQYGEEGLKNYEEQLIKGLEKENFEIINRNLQNELLNRQYSVGCTVKVDLGSDNFLLFALTKTEIGGKIPKENANVTTLWLALEEFWNNSIEIVKGKSIAIPLIGDNVAGITLSSEQILILNLWAIANAIDKFGRLTNNEIVIVIYNSEEKFSTIDLKKIKNLWK